MNILQASLWKQEFDNQMTCSDLDNNELNWTGERYLPKIKGSISLEHLHRYAMACQFSKEKNVLDIASGEGYGSKMLAEIANSVIGIDISKDAVFYSKNKYRFVNLNFCVGSCNSIPLIDSSIDCIACFETIEHHNHHEKMLSEFKRVLKPNGVLIISTPDKHEYSDITGYDNPFHEKELYRNEFETLLLRFFDNIQVYGQKIVYGSSILIENACAKNLNFEESVKDVGIRECLYRPVYNIIVASNDKIPVAANSIFEQNISKSDEFKLLQNKINLNEEQHAVAMTERECKINELYTYITDQEKKITDQEKKITDQEKKITDQEKKILEIETKLNDQIDRIIFLNENIADRDLSIKELEARIHKKDKDIFDLKGQVVNQVENVKKLTTRITQKDADNEWLIQEIENLRRSTSWKVTAPLRFCSSGVFYIIVKLRNTAVKLLRLFYHLLPVSIYRKTILRNWFYEKMPLIFRHTQSYGLWYTREETPLTQTSISQNNIDPENFNYSFNYTQNPLVSIIIPVTSKVIPINRCLRSIYYSNTRRTFEIIVIDDCSEDGTREFLGKITGIKIIRNENKLGFLRSCVLGAKKANGDFLLFLSNFSEVSDEWLDRLVETFFQIPKTGIVSSKLVKTDNSLEEAGCIIWRDGSIWKYGKNNNQTHPQFNYLRNIDSCSGLSFMIPKNIFYDMDFFDESYIPSIEYGIANLAFKLKDAGYNVLYQPLSKVVQYIDNRNENNYENDCDFNQIKKIKKIFYEKWYPLLRTHRLKGTDIEKEKERYISKRMLIIDSCTPTPDKDSGSVDLESYIKIIKSLGYKITFVPCADCLHMDEYTHYLQNNGVECYHAPFNADLRSHIRKRGIEYDVVMLYRADFAAQFIDDVKKFCTNATIIFNTVDLHYLRMKRQANIEKSQELRGEAERFKSLEISLINKTDKTIVVSKYEMSLLKEEGVNVNKVYNIPLIRKIPGRKNGFKIRNGIVFVGGFKHAPNVDTIYYFLNKIWPLIRKKIKGIEIFIIGSNMPEELRLMDNEGINAVGYVKDLDKYFETCRLSIAPIRYGAGLKGKVITSLTYGLPCVASKIAVEGFELVDGVHVLIADTPESFADSVCKIYTEEKLWYSISNAGLKYVNENHSFDFGKRRIEEMLSS